MRQINLCLNKQMRDLYKYVTSLTDLNKLVKRYLPYELAPYIVVSNFTGGCLVINTSVAWATQLRYQLPSLRDTLRVNAGLHQLSSIKIIISAHSFDVPLTKQRHVPKLSADACRTIWEASENCAYLPLKKALQHMAGIAFSEEN